MSTRIRVSSQLRIVRGLVLGLAMVVLTATAHASAHGQLPDANAFLLLTPISVGLGIIAMERPRGMLWFLIYALGVQSLMHVLLVTTAAHSSLHASLLPSLGMTASHLVSAAILAIMLARADSLLLRWLSYMRTILIAALQPFALVLPWRVENFADAPTLLARLTIEFAIARRGPPESRQ